MCSIGLGHRHRKVASGMRCARTWPQPMSYLHCPTCKCAYNIALTALCPNCPVPVSEVDPAEDIVAAAERLAHAMARATPSERKQATSRMDQLALPAPG